MNVVITEESLAQNLCLWGNAHATSFKDFSVRLESVAWWWKNFQKFMCAFKTAFFSHGFVSYQGFHWKGLP